MMEFGGCVNKPMTGQVQLDDQVDVGWLGNLSNYYTGLLDRGKMLYMELLYMMKYRPALKM